MSLPFEEYPEAFASHSRPAARVYRMRRDCFAAPSNSPGLEGIPVLAELAQEGISVFGGTCSAQTGTNVSKCLPVYATSADEPPAIPTGRIFVQGMGNINLEAIVRPLGYKIESRPPYAPDAAWLVASDRSIATALANLQGLIAAPGLESVEPQMLRPLHFRSVR